MRTLPKVGDRVKLVNSNAICELKEVLGDGAQGKVYKIKLEGRYMALKWYKTDKATTKQRRMIENLIEKGSPCERFLWPVSIAEADNIKGFGYIMGLKEKGYKSISDLVARKAGTSFKSLCTTAYQLADSYRRLHGDGLCYRDINFDNIFFNPKTGDIQICDNDNVGAVNTEASVLGTQKFMAPEVVRREEKPNIKTDRYSLVVLLFYLFINDHPLEGKKESDIKCFDLPAMKKIYGEEPVFIYNPDDKSNRPIPGEHKNALELWPIYPKFIKDLFIKVFTEGLNDVNKRLTENQWKKATLRLRDSIIYCNHCGLENFYKQEKINDEEKNKCWKCKKDIKLPYRIKFGSKKIVFFNSNAKLYPHHIDKEKRWELDEPVAEIAQHPKKPSVWGLKNLTSDNWSIVNANGENKEIPPNRSVRLAPGVKIDFGNREGEIIY